MKRVFFIGFLLSLFISCSSSKPLASKENIIELKGNPTTGYTWFYSIEDETVISVEEQIEYLGENGMVGAPSLFRYSVTGLKEGKTILNFEYKRGWETVAPIKKCRYEIAVDVSKRVKITEIESTEQ